MGVVATVNRIDGDLCKVQDGITPKCLRDVARLAHGMVAFDLLLVCKEAQMVPMWGAEIVRTMYRND
jgi:hypothetical protein